MNDGFCACTECVHVYKSGCVAHVCVCVCPSAAVYSMCQKPVRSKGKYHCHSNIFKGTESY